MGAFMAVITGSEGGRLQPIEEGGELLGGDHWGSMAWEEDGAAACKEEATLGRRG
jgi:hypothetical protein